ncbi:MULTISPECIES: GntR family transcriptional regulator [unclassified Streptomyces]|uniref:GntR family transcriptional regulator n=1 Tax=unclassified Streptomyces TaxID=2593676 RepID=UPI00226F8B04|nr:MULTISPECIES: GntR family transcriptional regulator [unclassified Streptomyces]MCY0923449.1 GntR family transcriptional regulator [Streptomyces sp. H27-G5]MCY0961875.1 GntR family transcriptional regulator [Streptomyces sp. H27-H5]
MAARYEEIARDLRERIMSGQYPPGSALPLMRDMVEEYGVSDITVRKAYGMLSREGLIESRGRAGTYVREHPDRVRLTVRSRQIERDNLGYYSGPETQHWRPLPHAGGELTKVVTAPVPTDIADLLGVEAGTELTTRRRIIGDPDVETDRQLADSWIAPWVMQELPELAGHTGLGGTYDRVEEWEGKPLKWREEISARNPSPEEADDLRMPRTGVPLLRALRVSYFPARGQKGERVVEIQDIRMSAALYAVGYPLPRGTSAQWPVEPATGDYYQAPDAPEA